MLSEEEVAHFVREGYIVRRGQVSRDVCDAALDHLWAAESKPDSIIRDDMRTHSLHPETRSGWAARDIGADKELLHFLPGRVADEPTTASEIWTIAEQLLGAGLIQPTGRAWRDTTSGGGRSTGFRCRGVYNTLPGTPENERHSKERGCHNEGHPFQVIDSRIFCFTEVA